MSRIGCLDVLYPAELATAPCCYVLIIFPLAVTCSLVLSERQCRAAQFAQVSQGFWQCSSSIWLIIYSSPSNSWMWTVELWLENSLNDRHGASKITLLRWQVVFVCGLFKLWFIVYLWYIYKIGGSYSGSLVHGYIIMSGLWNKLDLWLFLIILWIVFKVSITSKLEVPNNFPQILVTFT